MRAKSSIGSECRRGGEEVGGDEERGQAQHHEPPVDPPRADDDGRPGDGADDGGGGDRLPGGAVGRCRGRAAIGVSRLAGRNSAVTRPKTPSASETIAGQASVRCGSGSAAAGRPLSPVPVMFGHDGNPGIASRVRT